MVGGRLMIENNPLAVADDLSIDAAYWQWARKRPPARRPSASAPAPPIPISLQRAEHYVLLREDMISFEGDIGMPDMTYGWAKLTCEYLAQLAYQKHGLKSVCYRPFSGYGEDQDDAYPFPSICKRVLANRGATTLQVWGTGTQMRDFIHIEDCMDGILSTMDQIDDGGAVNLSTGIFTSFIEFARLAAEPGGLPPQVRACPISPPASTPAAATRPSSGNSASRPRSACRTESAGRSTISRANEAGGRRVGPAWQKGRGDSSCVRLEIFAALFPHQTLTEAPAHALVLRVVTAPAETSTGSSVPADYG